jgi:hypothetical protein
LITPGVEESISIPSYYGRVQVTYPSDDHAYQANFDWHRSGYQIAIDSSLYNYNEHQHCNYVACRPTNTLFDIYILRRHAVSEAISSMQSQAENEGTRYSPMRSALVNVFRRNSASSWNANFDKLESFSQLATGWDGYSARRPEKVAILSAKLFLSQLTDSDRVPDRVKPSVIGGIGVTFRANQRKCYVEFYNNGTVYALFSDGHGEPDTCQVRPTAQDYKLLINAIQDYLNAVNS